MAKRCRTIRGAHDEAVQIGRSHRQALLLSAFDTLASTSPGMIDAMTLSLPVEGIDEAAALQKLALELAEEHDISAEIAVSDNHLIVRLIRRDYGGT